MPRHIFALALALISVLSFAQDVVIVPDEAHRAGPERRSERPTPYVFPAGATITIETTGISLAIPSEFRGKSVNGVRVKILERDYDDYLATFPPGATRYVLSAASLQPTGGSRKFSGFRIGQQGMFALTNETDNGPLVLWVAFFIVQ